MDITNAQQAMEYLDKLAKEEEDELNAKLEAIIGGKTIKDLFQYLYFKTDLSKLRAKDRAKWLETVYSITKSQLPTMFGEDIAS